MKNIISKFAPQTFNDLLALMYFPFILVWIGGLALIYKYLNLDFFTTMGLGTANGLILSKFVDIYQFYFRKAKTEE